MQLRYGQPRYYLVENTCHSDSAEALFGPSAPKKYWHLINDRAEHFVLIFKIFFYVEYGTS